VPATLKLGIIEIGALADLDGADKYFDEDGNIANDGTRKFLESFMQAYAS